MNLLNELKRRNVFRVGAAYLVVSWLLIQIVDTVGDMLAMPDAFGRGVLILLAVGFPIALVVSWVYEVTPEGIATQEAVDGGVNATSGNKLNAVIITALFLAVVFLALDSYVLGPSERNSSDDVATNAATDVFQGEITTTADREKTIAVLPFANLSPESDQEYFADGITEELLNSLARLRGLQVTARTSSFYYKGKNVDLKEVGETLGVEYILEGSVRKAGDDLRITAQLIQADDGFHLWSETYDRKLVDVFAIQEEISNAVADQLSVALGVGAVLDRPGMTRDIEAFDLYLRSREVLFFTAGASSLRQMLTDLERAVTLDPDFTMAWIGLARIYQQMLSGALPISTPDAELKYEQATQQVALQMPDSPSLLELRSEEARSKGQWVQAEQILLEAIEKEQTIINYAPELSTEYQYAILLKQLGRVREAVLLLEQGIIRDPLNIDYSTQLLDAYASLFEFDETFAEGSRALTLEGEKLNAVATTFIAAIIDGDRTQIDRWHQELMKIPSTLGFDRQINDRMYESLDKPEQALVDLYDMAEDPRAQAPILSGSVVPLWAAIYGDPEFALAKSRAQTLATQRAFAFGFWRPAFKAMRQLEGFKDMVRDIGLVEYWRSTGEWGDFCRPLGSDDFECF